MICQYCGREIEDNATSCVYCGMEVPEEKKPEAPAPQPEKKRSKLVPILALVLIVSVIAAGLYLFVWSGDGGENTDGSVTSTPRQEMLDSLENYKTIGETFAQNVLLGNVDAICEATYPELQDDFRELFSNLDFIFESCTVTGSQTDKVRRVDVRAYESGLFEDYGVTVTMDHLYQVEVEFTAVYEGKEYGGAMAVLVMELDGQRYVVQAGLTDMDEEFYRDHFDQGDYYFDTNGEE